jgi:AcrR family transcriptional regulator
MGDMTRPRGRPRDPGLDRVILLSARAVIAERGFTGATMEEIAKQAGVGKDTLYRRWSSKEQLAVDLIDTMAREAVKPAAVDPDPRLNLLVYVKDIVRLNVDSGFGALIAGMVGEAARNDDLAESFRAFWQRRRSVAATLVRDIVGPSVGGDEFELVLDRVLAPIYYRLLLTREPITEEFLWDLITRIPWTTGPTQNAWDSGASTAIDTLEPVDIRADGAL